MVKLDFFLMIFLKFKKISLFIIKHLERKIFTYLIIGLLQSQQNNCYIGYLDLKDEKKELQSFLIQCEKKLQEENTSDLLNLKDNE